MPIETYLLFVIVYLLSYKQFIFAIDEEKQQDL